MSRYHKKIATDANGLIDLYAIAEAFGVKSNPQFHAMKKIMMAGERGHKSMVQDIDEAIIAVQRWKEMVQAGLVAVPESTGKPKTCPVCMKPGCEIRFHRAMELAEVGIQFKELTTEKPSGPNVVWLVDRPVVLEKQTAFGCRKCGNQFTSLGGCPSCDLNRASPEPIYEELEDKAAEFTAGIVGDLLGGKAKEKPAPCPVCKGGMGPEDDGSCPACGAPGVSCT